MCLPSNPQSRRPSLVMYDDEGEIDLTLGLNLLFNVDLSDDIPDECFACCFGEDNCLVDICEELLDASGVFYFYFLENPHRWVRWIRTRHESVARLIFDLLMSILGTLTSSLTVGFLARALQALYDGPWENTSFDRTRVVLDVLQCFSRTQPYSSLSSILSEAVPQMYFDLIFVPVGDYNDDAEDLTMCIRMMIGFISHGRHANPKLLEMLMKPADGGGRTYFQMFCSNLTQYFSNSSATSELTAIVCQLLKHLKGVSANGDAVIMLANRFARWAQH